MLTIAYGDDISASRDYINTLKSTSENPITLSGDSLDITELTQILRSGGLFAESKFLIIERMLSSKKSTSLPEIIELVNKNAETHTIIIWENKDLTKTQLAKFPKAILKQFKLPQTLFQLMDSLKPKNTKYMVTLYHSTRENVEEELILYMLARQIRLLLAVKTSSTISEIKQVSWQIGKLRKQADAFDLGQLKDIHEQIYEIEKAMKTGVSMHNTSTLIDFLLLKI